MFMRRIACDLDLKRWFRRGGEGMSVSTADIGSTEKERIECQEQGSYLVLHDVSK